VINEYKAVSKKSSTFLLTPGWWLFILGNGHILSCVALICKVSAWATAGTYNRLCLDMEKHEFYQSVF